MSPEFQKELETVFHEHLEAVDPDMVKKWYNGYRFFSEPVYNPFDVMLYLRNRMFKPYWFEIGTQTRPLFIVISRLSALMSPLRNQPITNGWTWWSILIKKFYENKYPNKDGIMYYAFCIPGNSGASQVWDSVFQSKIENRFY